MIGFLLNVIIFVVGATILAYTAVFALGFLLWLFED